MTEERATTIEARLADVTGIAPPDRFVEQANMADPAVYDRVGDFPDGFEEYARMLDWDRPWDRTFDGSDPPFFKWFVGGRLNASVNCVDRHLEERGDETAILWVGEPGEVERITYRDLYDRVNAWSGALRAIGVAEDDVVTIHLPMVPALPIAMLACARIGAPHSVVFGGFSAVALAARMKDAASRHLVTIDGYYRKGKLLDHKTKADEAIETHGAEVDAVVVVTRHEAPADGVTLVEGRDRLASELVAEHEGARVDPVSRDAEAPLFLMYTSGTTGRPKGVQHRTGGYLAYATATSKYVLDIKPGDVYWCAADIGWITGHSYIVYGPLSLGTTTLMYEGAIDHPDRDRVWAIAAEHDVDIFHTSPTAVRLFMKWGPEPVEKHDCSFRHLTTVGEPIQPRAWMWYYETIGRGEAVLVDTWWQTETGGHLIASLPAIGEMRPGSAGKPLPGIEAKILDDAGEPVPAGADVAGNLVISRPWPGMLQTLYRADERFIETYWAAYSDLDSDDWRDWVYKTGDGAFVSEDGFFRILGRLDDVMNVAGHRLGTMEMESAVVAVDEVAEAAVVARPDEDKGYVPVVYAVLTEDADDAGVEGKIVGAVEKQIGPFARPAAVHFVADLPKTRSGKIMRRLLQDISSGNELGDTTTLRDPSVPDTIRAQVSGQSRTQEGSTGTS